MQRRLWEPEAWARCLRHYHHHHNHHQKFIVITNYDDHHNDQIALGAREG